MSSDFKMDFSDFTEFADKLRAAGQSDALMNKMAPVMKEAGDMAIQEIKARTPVDTGELKRKWRVVGPKRPGHHLIVDIVNNQEYASFVEKGHRQKPGRYVPAIGKRLKAKWVDGQFMMRDGMAYVEDPVNQHLQKGFDAAVKSIFD
ncbi:HK97 gp10 family phage protein [Lacticaseibacillus sharpeae]|nr:HK97 gp10 family phage protein [Lacticaseibacillus sharpeae]